MQKCTITEADVKELGERNELLLREMERFDRMTRNIQKLVGNDIQLRRTKTEPQRCMDYVPGSVYGDYWDICTQLLYITRFKELFGQDIRLIWIEEE